MFLCCHFFLCVCVFCVALGPKAERITVWLNLKSRQLNCHEK